MNMFTLMVRSVLLYALILVVIRLMGKRQIGQMQPFELVLTLIIADIATIPMSETKIPFLHGIVPLLTLMVVHFALVFACNRSSSISSVVNGKPVIVVTPTGIDYKALKSLGISVDDIMEGIRGKGFFSLDEVEYVLVETTGIINVMPKAGCSPLTASDFDIKKEAGEIPVMIINEGSFMKQNISLINFDLKKINKILQQADIKKTKNVLTCMVDSTGKVFIQEKNKACKVFNINLEAGDEN